jgi:acyl transferase domain-containing protein
VNSFGYGGANAHCILDYPTSSNETTKVANGHDRIGENGDNEHISNGHDGKALNGLNGHARVDSVNITDMVEAGINGTDANGGEVKAAETTGANFNRGDVNGVESNGIHKSHSNDSATRRLVLLPFSAHLPGSLGSNIEVLREGIRELPLADVAYTLAKRRSKFQHRAFAIIEHENPDVGLETGRIVPGTSSSNAENVRLGFVFTGQGAQWQGMGSKLFEYKVFRDSIRQQDAALRQLSFAPTWSLEDLFAPNSGSQVSLEEAEVSQTACSALQVAVVDLLRCWGVTPSVVVGHSSGEIAAAYASGKATLEQSIITAFCRGRALATPQQPGAMLAVGLSVEETRSLLTAGGHDEHVQVAAVNSPQSVTIAGDAEKIDEIQRDLKAAGAFARLLKTSGKAYHSHHMRPVGKEYEATLSEVLPASKDAANNEGMEPRPRWISSVKPTKPTETTNARYWRENLESPVQFAAAVDGMLNEGVDLLIEIGPHAALQSPVKQIIAGRGDSRGPTYLPSLRRGEDGMRDMLTLCGHLWSHNYPVDLVTANATDDGRHGGVCKDLPRFRWVYGPPLNYETRITRHARERRHLRHDLRKQLIYEPHMRHY